MSFSRRRAWFPGLVPAALAIALLPAPARAQTSELVLEEIIVTARKREENLQEVPLSISVTTAAQIQERGIRNVQDLVQSDPSIFFDDGFAPGDVRIVIRGLSPTRGRPNVATLIDGIDISSEAVGIAGGSLLATPRLLDIEQVEIVKGPQSALFGRSAFGGAINYLTKDPAEEFEGSVNVDLNDGEQYSGTASVSFPLGETLGVRLNGLWYDEKGFYRNSITGNSVGGAEGLGAALTLKWEPSDSVSLKFRAEYTDDEFTLPAQAFIPFNGTATLPASASSCVGGIARDPTCTPTPFPSVNNSIAALEAAATAVGLPGTFNDTQITSFRGRVPDASDLAVTFTPNYAASTDGGLTGPDYAGSDRNVTRLSLVANWDVAFGRFSSLTGYTDANLSSDFDSDKFAIPGSQLGSDNSTVENRLLTYGTTEQFSQELRFTSDFDSPFNFVAGAQYWEEKVEQFDSNSNVIANGILCIPAGPMIACFPSGTRVGPFMDDVAAARGRNLTERDVEHLSAYLQLSWDISDQWGVSVEGRYVDEDNRVAGDDPIEISFPMGAMGETYYADAPNSGNSIVVLCGSTGPCGPLPPFFPGGVPRNPVRGFFPVGAGVVNNPALAFAPCPPSTPPTNSCIPPGTVLTNPGYIRNEFTRNDSYFTPRATVTWKPNDGSLIYASYAEGEKPGGFSTLFGGTGLIDRDTYEFEPEQLKEYELGAKFRISDRWIFNAAVFREDFSDKQVNVQIQFPGASSVVTRIDNAASAKIDGFELETLYRATEYLTLQAAFTYLDGEYDDYRVTSNGISEVARVGNCVNGYVDPGGFQPLAPGALPPVNPSAPIPGTRFSLTCQIDRSGNVIEDTPKYAFSGTATYRRPLGSTGLSWSAGVDVRYTDERFLEDDNAVVLDAYWLSNLRLGIEGERWSAIAYVDNIMDDDTVRSAGGGPAIPAGTWRFGQVLPSATTSFAIVAAPKLPTAYFANLPDPRVYGLRFGVRF